MSSAPLTPSVLLGTVVAVGVFHTLVPDHWAPIVAIARRRRWSYARTAAGAALAGTGHVLSTLALGLLAWGVGITVAARYGVLVNQAAAVALIAFGGWIAWGGWREAHHGHEHSHDSTGNERTALFLILGSSPMIEGLPAFFAAARYGVPMVFMMAILFALSTIGTYIVVSVTAAAGFQSLAGNRIERYGEFLSGAIVVLIGIIALFL
jgi:putative Mn2+ efflux pump MntP